MASGGQPYQIYHLVKNNIDSKTATNAIASRFIEFLLFSSFFVLIFIRKILKLLSNQFIGKKILIFGLAVSLVITVFMFVIFINPNIIVSFIKFLGKKTKKEKIINRIKRISEWTDELRESIIFLWTEKFYILIMDFILGIAETFVQAYAFFIILKYFSIMNLNFFDIFIIYILLNFVIYFVPTPGSSGGVEGIYNTVLIGLIGNKNYVIAAIFIWRLSTYYFQIIVQFFLMLLLRGEKNENSRINSNI
ncbi:MAG TPA: lysylphosphatidylglycerol synthase transmembrane domain-containing protein, partial [Tepiditoga sp.]|nr:lysylphosphatidylglycerol synthase transmembrane domain-containing protein [Tepiditoga sp.]